MGLKKKRIGGGKRSFPPPILLIPLQILKYILIVIGSFKNKIKKGVKK